MDDLFKIVVPDGKRHPVFEMLLGAQYGPERALLQQWGADFPDRDGKFAYEFQSTFEPCLWELYLNASLRQLDVSRDFAFNRPDFVATKGPNRFCLEATIAAPAAGGLPPFGDLRQHIPEDFNLFNSEAALRLANSFSSKVKKYRAEYSKLAQCANSAFVIAIASFDRPYAHFAATRPILSAMYGLYHDEDATIASGADNVISYSVSGVRKSETASVEMGYFLDDQYKDVSAVVYSCLATWGKVRALADNKNAQSVYVTFHPSDSGIKPLVRVTRKVDYVEDLLDGLVVIHNPFAQHPLPPDVFSHPRIAQFLLRPSGELEIRAPDDMLLSRFLHTVNSADEARVLADALGVAMPEL